MTIPYILYKTGPFDTVTQSEIVECFKTNEKMLKSKIVYFNDKACKNFIKQHFGPNVVKAYNMLIPGAYKADLWRLCVLYIHGGIYGDLTQTFLKKYDVNEDNADRKKLLEREFKEFETIMYSFIFSTFMYVPLAISGNVTSIDWLKDTLYSISKGCFFETAFLIFAMTVSLSF